MTLATPIALVDPWVYLRQALVRQLRSNLVLEGRLPGGWSEGVAPDDTPYPRGVYQLHYSPNEYDWTGLVTIAGVDVGVFAQSQGEAASLNQLVFTSLQDARFELTGLTMLVCRRVSTYSLVDAAPDGTPTSFQEGGIYSLQVAQSNPTNRTLSITLNSTIG
jgi:hypothetical protein